jgi:hypothetical protein
MGIVYSTVIGWCLNLFQKTILAGQKVKIAGVLWGNPAVMTFLFLPVCKKKKITIIITSFQHSLSDFWQISPINQLVKSINRCSCCLFF